MQMNRAEAQSLVEFVPPYVQYLISAAEHGCPTVLAKILGVYRIGFKNSRSGRTLKQDVLVMENLFVGRSHLQVFDLKVQALNASSCAGTDGCAVCLDAWRATLGELRFHDHLLCDYCVSASST